MRTLATLLTSGIVLCVSLSAQPTPVPFVNQPLIPASAAPGGARFILTLNGTGFTQNSVVNWNGSPRVTTFANRTQLTALILSTDIATPTTASITVSSASQGGSTSNVVFLPVREPSASVSLNASSFSVGAQIGPNYLAVGDFDRDGIQDMALIEETNTAPILSIVLGNGDGTFRQGAEYSLGNAASLSSADVNNDGNLDLVIGDEDNAGGLGVLLGNGDGTFQKPLVSKGTVCCSPYAVMADVNQDGRLDFISSDGQLCVFVGNGDGTFQLPQCMGFANESLAELTIGDFNGDGKLDIAASNNGNGPYFVSILLGNGDGTFQSGPNYPVQGYPEGIITADFNGDGRLDLAVVDNTTGRVIISYGNGDGNFRPGFTFATAFEPFFIEIADMNGDGKLDLVVEGNGYGLATCSILLGNGDGTFQPYVGYDGGAMASYDIADFNNDGLLDVGVVNGEIANMGVVTIMSQDQGTTAGLAPKGLTFPTQLVNTVSNPKVVTLTNTGTSAITISKISVSPNFSELTNCGTIQPRHICEIGVFFTPTTPGNIIGYMAVTDNAGGSPQVLNFLGTGTVMLLSPSSVNFGNVPVGTMSAPQTVTVTNKGNGAVNISGVGIGGANGGNFMQVNACPQQLPAGTSCNITVYFRPSAKGVSNGILGVADSGGGSPQTIPLSGTGT